MTSEKRAVVFALIAVGLWSTVATAFKIALQYHSVISLLTGASITSLLALGVILTYQKKIKLALTSWPKHSLQALLFGAINPTIYYLVLFEAYRRLPAQVAQPVNYTWAITLALLSVPILKQSLSRKDIIGLVLGYTGVVVISIAGKSVTGSLDYLGLALALLSTLLWAGFWLLNTRNKQDPIISLFHNFLCATPILIVLLIIFPPASFQWSFPAMSSMIYVGLFEMGITFVFWQLALNNTNNTARIGTLIFLSPFISLCLIALVLGEPLQLKTFLGLGLIIAGTLVSQRR